MKAIIILELSLLCILLFPTFSSHAEEDITQLNNITEFHLPANNYKTVPIMVTAYNVGIEAQNDEFPCIGAGNHNLCKAITDGTKIMYAANFVPLHTVCCVDTIGCGEVLDRMNKRFTNRLDIAMPADKLKEARQFGIKKLNYYCITN